MLTLQYIPYEEIEELSSYSRVKKIINHIKENKIVLLQGRLRKTEETDLIKKTMEEIAENANNAFKGIELSVIMPTSKQTDFMNQIKLKIFDLILGERKGMTIVGPASLIKEIKQDPNKLQLLIESNNENSSSIIESVKTNNGTSNSKKKRKAKKKK